MIKVRETTLKPVDFPGETLTEFSSWPHNTSSLLQNYDRQLSGGPRLEIMFFSQFRVYRGGKFVGLCANRKGQEIFRYLASHPQYAENTEVLMSLLWPEDSLETARRKMHIAVCALRKSLLEGDPNPPSGGYILCHNGVYQLNPAADISSDAGQFETLYRTGRNSGGPVAIKAYEKACKFYTGMYLTEDRYASWSLIQREQFALTYLKMCRLLALYYLEQQNHEEVANWALAVLREDRCDEVAWWQLIWSCGRAGHRSEAVQYYRRCIQVLAEELQIKPLPKITALYESILNGTSLDSLI